MKTRRFLTWLALTVLLVLPWWWYWWAGVAALISTAVVVWSWHQEKQEHLESLGIMARLQRRSLDLCGESMDEAEFQRRRGTRLFAIWLCTWSMLVFVLSPWGKKWLNR